MMKRWMMDETIEQDKIKRNSNESILCFIAAFLDASADSYNTSTSGECKDIKKKKTHTHIKHQYYCEH